MIFQGGGEVHSSVHKKTCRFVIIQGVGSGYPLWIRAYVINGHFKSNKHLILIRILTVQKNPHMKMHLHLNSVFLVKIKGF